MKFVKVYSDNVNCGKKYVCGVIDKEDKIQTIGLFNILFNKKTKNSIDQYHNFKYEEMGKEEYENYIAYITHLKQVNGVMGKAIKKIINSFEKEELDENGKEVYDMLYYVVLEYLNKENINNEFIIKEGKEYTLVSKTEKEFDLNDLRTTRLPDGLFKEGE